MIQWWRCWLCHRTFKWQIALDFFVCTSSCRSLNLLTDLDLAPPPNSTWRWKISVQSRWSFMSWNGELSWCASLQTIIASAVSCASSLVQLSHYFYPSNDIFCPTIKSPTPSVQQRKRCFNTSTYTSLTWQETTHGFIKAVEDLAVFEPAGLRNPPVSETHFRWSKRCSGWWWWTAAKKQVNLNISATNICFYVGPMKLKHWHELLLNIYTK